MMLSIIEDIKKSLDDKKNIENSLNEINCKIEKLKYDFLELNDKINLESKEIIELCTERDLYDYHIKNYFYIFNLEISEDTVYLKCFSPEDVLKYSKLQKVDTLSLYNEISDSFKIDYKIKDNGNNIFKFKDIKSVIIPINNYLKLEFFFFYEFDFEKIKNYINLLKNCSDLKI